MARRITDRSVVQKAVDVSAGANAGLPIVGQKINATGYSRARFIFQLSNVATTASLSTGLGVWQATTSGATFALIAGASAAAVTSGVISGGANNVVQIDVPVDGANPWLQLSGSINQTGAAHSAVVELYHSTNRAADTGAQQTIVV
jgi:hypothetical protein